MTTIPYYEEIAIRRATIFVVLRIMESRGLSFSRDEMGEIREAVDEWLSLETTRRVQQLEKTDG